MKNRVILFSLATVLGFSFLSACNSEHAHRWGNPTYTWSQDYSSCTATRVCLDDSTHIETESKNSVYTVVTPSSCSQEGKGEYKVTFSNSSFATQTHEVKLEKKEHTFSTSKITKFPSIFEKGEKTYYCDDCPATHIEEIEKVTDQTNYTVDATKLADLTGTFEAKAEVGANLSNDTIGIPLIAKQNLAGYPTYESPAIIQGAAVGYEIKTGPVEYLPIPGAQLTAPNSYFRYTITEVESKSADGEITRYKKLSGFDGTYYIVRVDVSNIIEGKTGFLHVKQENNKAMMVAMGEQGTSFADGMGLKVASYSLDNNAAALKDTTGNHQDTPYLDVVILSSSKLAAGADKGKETAPTADISLSFYVDEVDDYNPGLHYDPASQDVDHAKNVALKFFDETKAISGTNATSYLVKGDDLEIDSVTKETFDDNNIDEFWSMTKSLDYQQYNGHTIKLLCEVPVLEGLVVESRTSEQRNMVLDTNSFDVQIANHSETDTAGLVVKDNASLTILDHSNTVGAELAIGNNAKMEIQDGGMLIVDETCQLEVEYDAASIAHDTTKYTVDQVINKIAALPNPEDVKEIDRANIMLAVDAYNALSAEEKPYVTNVNKLEAVVKALPPEVDLNNGEVTVKSGGTLINRGIISIEGLEVKPGEVNPDVHIVIERDMKQASLLIEEGGLLENFGCLSIKGELYLLGTLNNYGKYDDLIEATDPDKGTIYHHKGIQLLWKDDVTVLKQGSTTEYTVNPDVRPGTLFVGLGKDRVVNRNAVLNNYGDIVLAPGLVEVYGILINYNDEIIGTGNIYLCSISEAVVPIVPTQDEPNKLEERRRFTPAYDSVLKVTEAHEYINNGHIYNAEIEIVSNGLFGKLTILLEK